jgi:hypothetical protein
MKCPQKITADYDWNDEPLETDKIEGLNEAIEHVRNNREDKILVRCDDRVADYDVYWNDPTDTVRFAAVVMGASYEVPAENDDEEGDA